MPSRARRSKKTESIGALRRNIRPASASARPFAMTVERHEFAFSRRVSPELRIILDPLERQRAQGRPGGRCTRGSRARMSCASAMTTGTGGDTPAFPARWFYDLYELSPVNHSVCHRRPHDAKSSSRTWRQTLGRQDHTISSSVKESAARQSAPSRPPHPRLTCRDDRDTPLRKRGGMRQRILLIYGNRNGKACGKLARRADCACLACNSSPA